jgi:hypothetical protein
MNQKDIVRGAPEQKIVLKSNFGVPDKQLRIMVHAIWLS